MRLFSWIKKKWIGYTCYSIIFAVIMLYYLFPSEIFQNLLVLSAEKMVPTLDFSIKGVSPSFPSGLRLEQVGISKKGGENFDLFRADLLSFNANIVSLIKKRYECLIISKAYGGDLTGNILFKSKTIKGPYDISMDFSDIDINKTALPLLFERQLEAILNGTATYSGEREKSFREGEGQADFIFTDVIVMLQQPIFGLEMVALDQVSLKTELKNRKLTLKNIEFSGDIMKGSMTGSISLSSNIMMSRINLKAIIEPLEGLDPTIKMLIQNTLKGGKLSFSITGTIQAPQPNFT